MNESAENKESKKNMNLFLEYNTFLKKETTVHKNHLKSIIQSVSEGMQEIDNFDMCSVWDEIYVRDNEREGYIKDILDSSINKIITNKKLKYFVSGPLVRSILLDTDFDKIKKDIFIYPIKTDDDLDISKCINMDYVIDHGNMFVGAIRRCKIIIHNYFHNSIPVALFGLNSLERMCYYNEKFMISAMFALDYFKSISIHKSNGDAQNVDPYLKTPRDILNIYCKNVMNYSKVQRIIDSINVNDLQTLHNKDMDSNIFFGTKRKALTPIEYAIYKYKNETNPMFKYNLKAIIMRLCTFSYIRDPVYFAHVMNIKEIDPELFKIIETDNYKYTIKDKEDLNMNDKPTDDIDSVVHNINMNIIEQLIKNDDITFVKFLEHIGYNKRVLKDVSSKTGSKIINMILDYNAVQIMENLITTDDVANYYKLYIILMSENINFIDYVEVDDIDDILLNYIDDVVKGGLLRSFYYLIKINKLGVIDYRTDNGNNVLHLLNDKDKSDDILALVMKLNDNLINEKNNDGMTPLHKFAENGLASKIDIVLGYEDVDYTITDNEGNTFLHYLCKYGHTDIIKNCIRRVKSILNEQNANGETPVLMSCINKHEEIYYILKGLKANLFIQDRYGNTVYHYICLNGICCSLIVPSIENNFGYTPYDYCKLAKMYYNFV